MELLPEYDNIRFTDLREEVSFPLHCDILLDDIERTIVIRQDICKVGFRVPDVCFPTIVTPTRPFHTVEAYPESHHVD